MGPPLEKTAVVLSAGGVRGAYQVGVLDGIVDVLGLRGVTGRPIFDIFSGTSIGALNAAYLAANADRADHDIGGLVDVWSGLEPATTLRFSPRSLLGWPRRPFPMEAVRGSRHVGRSLFDPRPIAALIERMIAWERLRANIDDAVVRALFVAAFDIGDDHTTLFADVAPGVELLPTEYPALRTRITPVTADTVQASLALPFVFPAVSIDGRYYMDGALRFSTPILPALFADARRVLVISLLREPDVIPRDPPVFPGLVHLLGEVCNALILDPVIPDLQSLLRTNRIYDRMAEVLEPAALAGVVGRLERDGVLPRRSVPTLVFRPSEDIATITSAFIREELHRTRIRPLRRAVIRMLAAAGGGHPALLASILLFDGRLAARLIELGRRDAYAAREEILAFFSGEPAACSSYELVPRTAADDGRARPPNPQSESM